MRTRVQIIHCILKRLSLFIVTCLFLVPLQIQEFQEFILGDRSDEVCQPREWAGPGIRAFRVERGKRREREGWGRKSKRCWQKLIPSHYL